MPPAVFLGEIGGKMKKILSALCAFVLLLGAGLTLSACGKKKSDNTIKFESGEYACIAQADTLTSSETLTETEQNIIVSGLVIEDFDNLSLVNYAKKLLDNTYIKLNSDSINLSYFTIIEGQLFTKISATIKAYTFKNDTLTFEDTNGKYIVTKDEEGNLVCQFNSYYDFGNGFETNEKLVFSITVNFQKLTEESDKAVPTEESFYANKEIVAKYQLTSVSNLDAYYKSFASIFQEGNLNITQERFSQIVNNVSNGRIILFSDNTLYYVANVDINKILIEIEPMMALFLDQAGLVSTETEIGYICDIVSLDSKFTATAKAGATSFEYTIDGDNLIATVDINSTSGDKIKVTYTFIKISDTNPAD